MAPLLGAVNVCMFCGEGGSACVCARPEECPNCGMAPCQCQPSPCCGSPWSPMDWQFAPHCSYCGTPREVTG